jgi:hypothetical protein
MKNKLFAAICCMILLAGCQQNEEFENSNNLQMSVEASIDNPNTASRYAGDAPNDIEFTNNDAIGISVNNEDFLQWTYNGSNWNASQITNWNDKSSSHKFIAFYPYAKNANLSSVPMPDLTKQNGTMASVATCDFLVTQKEQTYGENGTVSFTSNYAFKHVSSLVTINLKGEGELANATITNISITGTDILTPTTYSFTPADEDESPITLNSEEENKKDLLSISPSHAMTSAGATFYFVLNPNTVELSGVKLSIKYTKTGDDEEGKEYLAELVGLGTTNTNKFDSGKQYSYSLKIAGGLLVITGNDIADWGTGLTLEDIVINGSIITE